MLDRWSSVIFDLDGTLVELAVDWDQVEGELNERLNGLGVDVPDSDAWEYLDVAQRAGVLDQVEPVIVEHEVAGARASVALPLAEYLPEIRRPVGVCSLNCERACRIALERHELADDVTVVVGRDSVSTRKPDPEPLESVIAGLGADPNQTVFIGDSERDEITARRAGVAFRSVADVLGTLER